MNFPARLQQGDQAELIRDPQRLLIGFVEPIDPEDAVEFVHEFDLRLEDEDRDERDEQKDGERDERSGQKDEDGDERDERTVAEVNTGQQVNHTDGWVWVRSDEPIREELIERVRDHDEVDWVSPVYRRPDLQGLRAYVSPLPNVLTVRFREHVADGTVRRIEEQYGLTDVEEKSEHLGPFHYYRVTDADESDRLSYDLRERLLEDESDRVEAVRFESVPLVSPVALVPDDTFFGNQWDMNRIEAPDGWDLETGDNAVVIGVLDEGSDMNHDDLNFVGPGFNAGTGTNNGAAIGNHGTAVAGIASALTDNGEGVAGVAGGCRIHSVAIPWSDVNVAAAINQAANVADVDVINMSFGSNSWDQTIIDPAIQNAHDTRDVVLCAATHNHNSSTITYPATHPDVIAVGASDQNDERKRPASPDGESWGSNWGPEIDVVAPGVQCWTTDRGGNDGYNSNGGGAFTTGGVTYPSSGSADGDYFSVFNGTSAATPHVAGLAGLLRSRYPTLDNDEVRTIIERTCQKVSTGTYTYSSTPDHPNGDWHQEMGYGRIDVFEALDSLSVDLLTPTITFNDVVEGQTTVRAAVFSVRSHVDVTLEIANGPTSPFDVTALGDSTTVGPTGAATTEGRLFVSYTGTTAGDAPTGSVTVRCVETGEEWTVDITANTIARPTTAVDLVLDKSGSMSADSGVETEGGDPLERMELLKKSAPVLVDLLEHDDGIGVVSFDTDAQQETSSIATAGSAPFGSGRDAATSAIEGLGTGGATSIGDGVHLAHSRLGPLSGYDRKAMVVLTDGHENQPRYLADVMSLVNGSVFAIGMGTADQIRPAALGSLVNGTGGELLLTDVFDSEDRFRLAKYYLQILSGVKNEDIVVDPEGRLGPGDEHRIPFSLTAADASSDAILLVPTRNVFDFELETPDGERITTGSSYPEVSHVQSNNVAYYRMNLPVSAPPDGAHEGQWTAVLSVNEKGYHRYLQQLEETDPKGYRVVETHGVRYNLSVHTYSNLRLKATLDQDSREPGATLTIQAVLTESDLPVENRASVRAKVTRPSGVTHTLSLTETDPGVFESTTAASASGIYRVDVAAEGRTVHGRRFTRERLLTGAVWHGGDQPLPTGDEGTGTDDVCRFLRCLLETGQLDQFLDERGIDPRAFRECLNRYCEPVDKSPETDRRAEGPGDVRAVDFEGQFSDRELVRRLSEVLRERRR